MRILLFGFFLLISCSSIGQVDTFSLKDTSQFPQGTFTTRDILFDLGKPGFWYHADSTGGTLASDSILTLILHFFQQHPMLVVKIGVHMDSRGRSNSCIVLTQRRAKLIADYLIEHGIPPTSVIPVGYGESDLLVSDAEIAKAPTIAIRESLHQLNRRVVLTIVSSN